MAPINQPNQSFLDIQSEFYHYMITDGKLSKKAASDYLSRLKFLTQYYTLDSSFNEDTLTHIIQSEKLIYTDRNKYNTKKSISDFKSGLFKFLNFINSGYIAQVESEIEQKISAIQRQRTITETERENIIKSRLGQGLFRDKLIALWRGCAVTGCKMTNLLIASHIKPWAESTNEERLDAYNGLLLIPNIDKLFDRGYVSFLNNGRIILSKHLQNEEYEIFGINKRLKLNHPISTQHMGYLDYHRTNRFID